MGLSTRMLIYIEEKMQRAVDGIAIVFWCFMTIVSSICVFTADTTPTAITSGCVFIGCSIRFGMQAVKIELKKMNEREK